MVLWMLLTALAQTPPSAPGSPPEAAPAIRDATLTGAERCGFERTSSYEEVVATLDAIACESGRAARVSLGTSAEGRDIPMLVLADPVVRTGAEARAQVERDGKVVVFAMGNIHGGEVEGKEALVMMARDILGEADGRTLRGAVVVIAPIYNCDGNERLSEKNRPHQNGPREVGARGNGRGRDLNRDFMKAEEPETGALLRFLNEWDPHVFIDCHATNGSYHRYALTYAGPKHPAGDAEIVRYSRETFMPALTLAYEAASGRRSYWYGNFEGEFEEGPRGHTRWESFPAEPRYGTNYVGLRNRLSILTEAYVYLPFRERVEATREFVRLAVLLASENRERILGLTNGADARSIAMGEGGGDAVAVRTRMAAFAERATILGFEEVWENGRSVNTGRMRDYECEVWDDHAAEVSVPRAWGYAIPDDPLLGGVIAALRRHGVEVERVDKAREASCERLTIVSATAASRAFEGHVLVHARAEAAPVEVELAAGTYVVRTAQRLGSLVVNLLEPEGEDSLAAWNFFDAWMKEGAAYPVLRVMRPGAEGRGDDRR